MTVTVWGAFESKPPDHHVALAEGSVLDPVFIVPEIKDIGLPLSSWNDVIRARPLLSEEMEPTIMFPAPTGFGNDRLDVVPVPVLWIACWIGSHRLWATGAMAMAPVHAEPVCVAQTTLMVLVGVACIFHSLARCVPLPWPAVNPAPVVETPVENETAHTSVSLSSVWKFWMVAPASSTMYW